MFLYDSRFLDGVALTLFAIFFAMLAVLFFRLWRRLRARRRIGAWRILFRSAPALAALVALLLTYSTVRTQTKLTAEVALNESAEQFVSWEMEEEMFKCLYNWHAFNNPSKCRELVFSSPENFRKTMLYIEEALFLITKANKDRAVWGTEYSEATAFWPDDVSEDPTGLFSYAIVIENQGEVEKTIRAAGLEMSLGRVCRNFEFVRSELKKRGVAEPDAKYACP